MASDDKTDPDAESEKQSLVGETVPPKEHTERLRARIRDIAGMRDESVVSPSEAEWTEVERDGMDAKPTETPSWFELTGAHRSHAEEAQPSATLDAADKAERRARDAKAERRAVLISFSVLLALGAAALLFVNTQMDGPAPRVRSGAAKTPKKSAVKPAPKPPKPVRSSTPRDIPALRHLEASGLTIAAVGLPEVLTESKGPQVGAMAAMETCRFSYGVWEFSPNRRFRFLTTCRRFSGQVLVGAYEVNGAIVRMSPLMVGDRKIVSDFHVETPSQMKTKVSVSTKKGTHSFSINQRITSLSPGLSGEKFRDGLVRRNTVP